MFWPFTVWINCFSDLKTISNSRPSASNFKSFSLSLEQFFLTAGRNNFGNKIPIFHLDAEHGFPTFDAGIASDDLADLKWKLSTAFDHGDLVVTTGGVSMGDKDLLRQILVQVRFLTTILHRGLRNGFFYTSFTFSDFYLDFYFPFWGVFQLLDLIITELKSHMTCYNSMQIGR